MSGKVRRVTQPDINPNAEGIVNQGFRKSVYDFEEIRHKNEHPDPNPRFSTGDLAKRRKSKCSSVGAGTAPVCVVRNACKSYTKGVPVLQDFNMTVVRGAIYSLLGSSGCGKTTALSCIVGVRKLNSGEIFVLDEKPGVRGKQVGYMPQDTSLYDDFSIAETLSYFGTLVGMSRGAAGARTDFLTTFLRLPESSRRVGTLSGGQRRRVSFAAAIVHEPDFLILDEPTVGVDPLLREAIWKHLVELATDYGTTIVITTHYIDEASDSSMVGVMRYGRILVEENPNVLLEAFQQTSLEDVVLQLCRKDEGQSRTDEDGAVILAKMQNQDAELGRVSAAEVETFEYAPDSKPYEPHHGTRFNQQEQIRDSMDRIKALGYKNLVVLFRNWLLLIFAVVLPGLIVFTMCVGFKADPFQLPFGVVNLELLDDPLCLNQSERSERGCDIENLSCKYMKNIPEGVLTLMSYKTDDDAVAAVKDGSIFGYMTFPEEFSAYFYERSAGGADVDESVFNASEIIVKMDQTGENIVLTIKKALHDGFEDYGMELLKDCGLDPRQAQFPFQSGDPIFGSDDLPFVNFLGPSVAIGWLNFLPIMSASIRFINEKRQGTYDRSLVSGTNTWEILLAFGATECIGLGLQSVLTYFVISLMDIELLGSTVLVLILFLLSGLCGVAMGLCIGSLFDEEIHAALLAMAIFFPNLTLSGIFWPAEGMPLFVQYVAYLLPTNLSAEAMRSIYSRGWPFTHSHVWPGYLVLTGYIVLSLCLTVFVQKVKSK